MFQCLNGHFWIASPFMSISLLLHIILACVLGGILSVAVAALVMFGLSRRWLAYAVSFSIGVLLATSLLHLLPEALESGLTPHEVFPTLLAAILGFFALEKFANWRHSHGDLDAEDPPHGHAGDEAHTHPHAHSHAHPQQGEALSILVGDAFHNFTDGLLIASAFLTDPALGWATTLAIVAHEVPQEASDFAILLGAGWSRMRALFWNGVSSLTALAGGVLGYFAMDRTQAWIPYIITIAAASFMYIAISDLMPRLKHQHKGVFWHGLLVVGGLSVAILGSGHSH